MTPFEEIPTRSGEKKWPLHALAGGLMGLMEDSFIIVYYPTAQKSWVSSVKIGNQRVNILFFGRHSIICCIHYHVLLLWHL